ncbi:arsenate reductase family protein [Termitidicoccus mucosus]|uniref:ArsC family transcriptional regulator n=1 Tax=Termitidicoccus mucosus TaxID=1184151 RepID=A0A178IKV8_9BACT|nr:ArsC family transcriptional regulator [Opitutaceae bacterium TSB47]
MLTIYTYAKCSTCRDAVKWLRAHNIAFAEKPIRETPPAPAELRAMLAHQGGQLRRLFNTSGQDYRALGLKDKLPAMSEAEALKLLSTNGNLVKRPFVLGRAKGGEIGMVGFKPEEWTAVLLQK